MWFLQSYFPTHLLLLFGVPHSFISALRSLTTLTVSSHLPLLFNYFLLEPLASLTILYPCSFFLSELSFYCKSLIPSSSHFLFFSVQRINLPVLQWVLLRDKQVEIDTNEKTSGSVTTQMRQIDKRVSAVGCWCYYSVLFTAATTKQILISSNEVSFTETSSGGKTI